MSEQKEPPENGSSSNLSWLAPAIDALGKLVDVANDNPVGILAVGALFLWGTIAAIAILSVWKDPAPLDKIQRLAPRESPSRFQQRKDSDGGTIIDVN